MGSDDWIPEATRTAMDRVVDHARKVGLANTEEFTFRAFFMAAASELLDEPRFQAEWSKFDLLVQNGDTATVIEFKYYILRRTYRLDGTPGPRKGAAGPKNEAEFHACINKLRTSVPAGINARRLVLIYERDDHLPARRRHSFHTSYGELAPSGTLARVWSLSNSPLEARILEPTPVG